MKGRTGVLLGIGLLCLLAVGISRLRPSWICSVAQVAEDDGMRQTDRKWFGIVPISTVEHDPSLAVRPQVMKELAGLVKHPPTVDAKKIDFLMRDTYPQRSCYVRLMVHGDLKAIFAAYASQIGATGWAGTRGKVLLYEVDGTTGKGVKLNLTMWASTASGRPYDPKEGMLAFSWDEP